MHTAKQGDVSKEYIWRTEGKKTWFQLWWIQLLYPVTRRLSKFVVCTIGKGCLQKKNKFIPIWKMFRLWFRMIIIQSQNLCVDNYCAMYMKISKVCTPFSSFVPANNSIPPPTVSPVCKKNGAWHIKTSSFHLRQYHDIVSCSQPLLWCPKMTQCSQSDCIIW